MARLTVFFLIVLGLAFGFAWIADRPGTVNLEWQGVVYETSLMVVIGGLLVLLLVLAAIWWLIAAILRSPYMVRRFMRNRRRDRGYYAITQGLIAAGSGDVAAARSHAASSRKLLGSEPLVKLLEAQTLLLDGDHEGARRLFSRMLEDDDTRLIALRGLHHEAEREGEAEAARHYAQEAAKAQPKLPWAARALLRYQSLEGDFEGALRTLENLRSSGQISKEEAQRKRAVLLTGQAMQAETAEPDRAARLAREGHRLAPDLAPAATIAAQALMRTGDLRRAASLLETSWKLNPHPEIAAAYVHLRSGDTVADRLKRARRLDSLNPGHPAGAFAIAEAAIAAGEWNEAREAMKPLLGARPSKRACAIMAQIEQGQYGDKGRMREWLSRALHAPADPAWIADGHVSERWLPVSPVTGELDAFQWRPPLEQMEPLAPAGDESLSGLIEPLAEERIEEIAEPLSPGAATIERSDEAIAAAARSSAAGPLAVPPQSPSPPAREERVVPLQRPPDDPGIEPESAEPEAKKTFGLF